MEGFTISNPFFSTDGYPISLNSALFQKDIFIPLIENSLGYTFCIALILEVSLCILDPFTALTRINKIDQNVNHATIPLKGKEGRGKGCRISNLMSHIRMFWFTREWYDKEHIPYNLAFDNCTFSQMIFASEDETATTTTYAKVKSYRYSIFLMIG